MKNQVRTTPVAYLPGKFCASLADDNVFCTWKGQISSTWLLYFWVGPDDPEIPPGYCRNLAILEYDYCLETFEEAEALAKASWDLYQKQILAVNGDLLAVEGFNPESSTDKS